MIDYERTKWYGLAYLIHWKGILLPRLLPIAIMAATISTIVSTQVTRLSSRTGGTMQAT